MAISSHAVANEFIRIAQEQERWLTNMQLQKLVFIANGYHLAIYDEPLYYHNSHAWQYGPVIPKLYKSLQKYGASFVQDYLEANDSVPEDSREARVIKAVFDNYGHYTGGQLSVLTHQQNTPWSEAWGKQQFSIINPEVIKKHYKELIEKNVS